jgi:transcriptional regulator with XRE-family HTH domain
VDPRRFGAELRAHRTRRQLSQARLETRCGIGRSKISRIERGAIDRVPFGDIVAPANALDARVEIDVSWRGASLDRLVDARHAALVGAIVQWLSAADWTCVTEVSFSIWGERGSVDVLAIHLSGSIVVIEAMASVSDANPTLIALDRKIRLAPEIVRQRGLPSGAIGGLLVITATTTNPET